MLPAAPPFLPPQAGRWVRAGLPCWVTGALLPALWLVAIAVAVAGDTTRCTPQDPSVCGPDSGFAFAFVLLMATPVLLWWMPPVGCLAGVAFALVDLRYDDETAARWAFGCYGLLCALIAVRLVRGAAEQRRIADAVAGSSRATAPVPPVFRPEVTRWAVIGALVLAGIGSFAWYGHQVSTERAHLQRAVQITGRIVEVRTDDSISVQVRTPSAGSREYRIGVYDSTDPYSLHSSAPVLLDPRDPGWIRLVAEPQDVTYWQSAGAGCLLLALLVLLHGWRWLRGRGALGSVEQAMLRVRIYPDEKGRALILPAFPTAGEPSEQPIGRLAVFESAEPARDVPAADGWDYQAQADFGQAWRDEDPAGAQRFTQVRRIEDAVLIGDLHDGGVAMLVTDEAVLLPAGRLRAGRVRGQRPFAAAARGGPPQRLVEGWQRLTGAGNGPPDGLFAGAAVDPASLRRPIELPVTARPAARDRGLGLLVVLACFAGLPVVAFLARPGLPGILLLASLTGTPVASGADRLFSYLRLDHHRFEVAGVWRTYSIPWDRLHGVRQYGQALSVAWQPDVVMEVGPFVDPAGELGPRDWTEQVGAMMLLQRQRALLGGLPGRRIRGRPSPTAWVLAGYAVLTVALAVLR